MAKIELTGPTPVSPVKGYGRDGKMEQRDHPHSSRTPEASGRQTKQPDSPQDRVQLSREALQISKLAANDRAVKDHEAAHQAVGGQYAGSADFAYQHGPDGKRYAVSGEVTIDASPVAGDPEATMKKAQTVRAAALAPVDPSPQDHQVAIQAARIELQAKAELQTQHVEEAAATAKKNDNDDIAASKSHRQSSASTGSNPPAAADRALSLYA